MESMFRTMGARAGYTKHLKFESTVYTSVSWDRAYITNRDEFGRSLDCRISFAEDGQAVMLIRPDGLGQAKSLIATATELAKN